MAAELDNMRRLHEVVVKLIEVDPVTFVVRVQYVIQAEDGSVMYAESFSKDASTVPNVGTKTIAELKAWAETKAAAHAKAKYGKA